MSLFDRIRKKAFLGRAKIYRKQVKESVVTEYVNTEIPQRPGDVSPRFKTTYTF